MPTYKTKGELRSDLLVKLGYGGLGAAAANFVPMADLLLEEAQRQLLLFLPDDKLTRVWQWQTGISQRFYDFPLDSDPDRICELAAFFADEWLPMKRGIDSSHDSIADEVNYYPQRYDIRNVESVIDLQTNSDFATEDVGATGGSAGWSWDSGTWEITGGVAVQKAATMGTMTSDTAVVIGETYDVAYSLFDEPAVAVTFGGTSTDDDGQPLKITNGTHTHRVTAVTTVGLTFEGANTGILLGVDNVSVSVTSANPHKEMLEFWPLNDTDSYPVKLEGFIQLMPFVADGDRATIDDLLILQYAEAHGKAHLNKPDAQVRMQALNKRLMMLRGQQHNGKRYIRGAEEPDPVPRPIVIT